MTLSLDRLRELHKVATTHANLVRRVPAAFDAVTVDEAIDTLAALDDLIRRIEADRWHPASEPPNNGRDVLVRLEVGRMEVAWYSQNTGWTTTAVIEWREMPEAT